MDVITARPGESTPTPYYSVLNSLWITCVTMMMVGYGEVFPTTDIGRLVAALSGILGLLFMALPVIVVGFHFTIAVVRSQYKKLPARVDAALEASKKGTVMQMLEQVNEVVG